MEHKNDIGSLLKDRLETATKVPSKNLWERIDNSLKECERKRRLAAWIWYGSGTFLILGFIFFGYITNQGTLNSSEPIVESTEQNTTQINISAEKDMKQLTDSTSKNMEAEALVKESNYELETNNTSSDVMLQTSIKVASNDKTVSSTQADNNNNEQTTIKDTSNTSPKTRSSSSIKQNKPETIHDEGYTVNKSYSYYNSETKMTSYNLSKQQLDSILNAVKLEQTIKD